MPMFAGFRIMERLWDPVNSTVIRRKQRDKGFYPGLAPLVG
jgi:hypothetical protein